MSLWLYLRTVHNETWLVEWTGLVCTESELQVRYVDGTWQVWPWQEIEDADVYVQVPEALARAIVVKPQVRRYKEARAHGQG